MSKVGLCTKEEAKFFGKVVAGAVPVNGVFKPVVGWLLPSVIDTADDKFGDRVPEPWQSDLELLVTMVYEVMQDNVVTEEEEAKVLKHCANVINSKIDLPWFGEDDEAVMFISGMQFLASIVRKAVKKNKVA